MSEEKEVSQNVGMEELMSDRMQIIAQLGSLQTETNKTRQSVND